MLSPLPRGISDGLCSDTASSGAQSPRTPIAWEEPKDAGKAEKDTELTTSQKRKNSSATLDLNPYQTLPYQNDNLGQLDWCPCFRTDPVSVPPA